MTADDARGAHETNSGHLEASDLSSDPWEVWERWYDEAGRDQEMVLATATRDGAPSARMVLLKHWDRGGFVFFTNYDSAKGRDLSANPQAAVLFRWPPGRQVRASGPVAPVSSSESDAYWRTRPRGSRLSAAVSPQSDPIASRHELEDQVAALVRRYPDGAIPRPARWGGYRLDPDRFEFWQHGEDRLHDRFAYLRAGDGWSRQRLAP